MARRHALKGDSHRVEIRACLSDVLQIGGSIRHIFHFDIIFRELSRTRSTQPIECEIARYAEDISIGALDRRREGDIAQTQPGVVQTVAGEIRTAETKHEPTAQPLVIRYQHIAQRAGGCFCSWQSGPQSVPRQAGNR